MPNGRWLFRVKAPGVKRALYASKRFDTREEAERAAAELARRLELEIVEIESRSKTQRRRA